MTRIVQRVMMSLAAMVVLASCSQDAESGENAETAETVEIGDVGVVFEKPATWVELDLAEARAALADDEVMAELIKKHGPDSRDDGPVETFISTTAVPLQGSDPLFVASAKGTTNDVLPQMTVQVNQLDSLPSLAEIERPYRDNPLGIDYVDLTELDTAVGPAVLVAYSTALSDPDWHWAQLNVDTGSDVVAISFVTADRSTSEQLAMSVAESLEHPS